MTDGPARVKPRLRGLLHLYAFIAALPALPVLLLVADRPRRLCRDDLRTSPCSGERALPPRHVVAPRAPLDGTARPRDDQRPHRGHVHALRAARAVPDARGRVAGRRVGWGARGSPPPRPLDRRAEVAERAGLPRPRLERHRGAAGARGVRRLGTDRAPRARRSPLLGRRHRLHAPPPGPGPGGVRLPRGGPCARDRGRPQPLRGRRTVRAAARLTRTDSPVPVTESTRLARTPAGSR